MQQHDILQLPAVQAIVKKINRLMYEDVWDLHELEQQIRRDVLALGEVLIGEAIAKMDEELRTSHCRECGGTVHSRKRSRTIATLVGKVRFQRSRGSCQSCGAVVYWVDRELGIDAYQGSSRGFAALKALCAASWGYARSAEVVSGVTGIPTNAMAVHRTVTRPEAAVRGRPSAPARPATVHPIMVDADGVLIHRREPAEAGGDARRWMEGKVACVWTAKERVSRDRWALVDKRYYATFASFDQIAPPVYQDVFNRARARYPAQQVVVRGDGGGWIRTFYREWFARGRLLLDAYHLRKKIRTRLREALLPADPDRLADSQRLYQQLVGGKLSMAAQSLMQLKSQTKRLRDPVALRKLEAYLARHQEGMWYPHARAEGIDIGTGAIEKAGDIVICRRFKLRGMRWSRSGADALLAYRLLVLNGEWDAYWQTARST
jgi:hypothetical protein